MAKIVKLNKTDLSKLVNNIVEEQIELSAPEMVKDPNIQNKKELELRLAKDDEGTFYLVDDNGKVYLSGK